MKPISRCPICSKPQDLNERYPKYVCNTCRETPKSLDGRKLIFFNLSISGGFGARYADSGEEYSSHECYIGDIKCYADEARFGGIVIQVDDDILY